MLCTTWKFIALTTYTLLLLLLVLNSHFLLISFYETVTHEDLYTLCVYRFNAHLI